MLRSHVLSTRTHTGISERGRTLTEMLSVLAVMGVLALVGIKMYNVAMNNLQANNVLYEINKMAHSCATQMSLMGKECSLPEYGNAVENYSSSMVSFPNNYFGIKLAGVSKTLCQQIHTKGLSIASEILPAMCSDTNDMIFIFSSDLSGKTDDMPQSCTPETAIRDCKSRTTGNVCANDGFCRCASGRVLISTGCCKKENVLNGVCCSMGITTDATTGEQLCCSVTDRCCPLGKIWIDGVCEDCSDPTAFYSANGNMEYCKVCPNRVLAQWTCRLSCVEADQIVANGECHCPFERPIMIMNKTAVNYGKCVTCAEGDRVLNGANVPLGYDRTEIARLCNYKGGTGGYSSPCAEGEVGLWFGETYTENGETLEAEKLGTCVPCSAVTTGQLNSRARCESCGGVWQSSAPNTQDEWLHGTCTGI